MNRIYRLSVAAVSAAVVAVSATGCDNSKLTSDNNNPNAPTAAPAPAVFTNAVQAAVSNWLGSTYNLRNIELIVQHLAENQYIGNDQYKGIGPSSLNTQFRNAYQNDLEDFQVVTRSGLAAADASLYGPSLVMQQWEFGYITDNWGDIPYSQALAGDSASAVLLPAYDPQQAIYTGMFAALTKAAKDMGSATKGTLGSADPIYGGSMANWQKFANSLHARDAMRIVNVDPATANTELKAALSGPGGVFTSNADNAQLVWPGDGVFNNPWATNFSSRDDDRMSKTFIDTLNNYNDPRVPIYAMPAAASGKYAGQPNGLTNAQAVAFSDNASRPGAIFYPGPVSYGSGSYGGNGNKYPSYLMTYAEMALIQAEAAARSMGGLTPGQAAGFYNAGISASMSQWGVTDAGAIAAYLAQPAVAYQGGTAGLKQIALQKWIALYADGGQAWFEWRRTCVP
ncbi:MAG: SusD/RagB family nutrient-binding outer membrane lipoprotein, partial [Gemmatimonadaceae bacterium]